MCILTNQLWIYSDSNGYCYKKKTKKNTHTLIITTFNCLLGWFNSKQQYQQADLMCPSTPESQPAGRQTPQSRTSSPGSGYWWCLAGWLQPATKQNKQK